MKTSGTSAGPVHWPTDSRSLRSASSSEDATTVTAQQPATIDPIRHSLPVMCRTISFIQHHGNTEETVHHVGEVLSGDGMTATAARTAQEAVRDMLDAADTLATTVDLTIRTDGDEFTITVRTATGRSGRIEVQRNLHHRSENEDRRIRDAPETVIEGLSMALAESWS